MSVVRDQVPQWTVPRSEFNALLDHTGSLLTGQLWSAMRLHASQALELAQNTWQAGRVLHLCVQVPEAVRLTPEWASLVAYAAFRANDAACCEAHLDPHLAEHGALRAWLLMRADQADEALLQSEQGLVGPLTGVAWRMRAWAMASLQQPGWETAFHTAAEHNSGRQRGIALLQLGGYLSFSGREAEARSAYAEAAPYFEHDPELRATAVYNVGTACLRLSDFTAAERAYQEAMRWATRPEGASMVSRAWSGLGHLYRAIYEWPRALHAYAVAQTKATELDDVAQAWRGRAHTLRLARRHDEALITLHEGLARLGYPEQHGLYADLAALQVSLGDTSGAERSLHRIPEGREEERQRASIVRAELARRAGDPARAAELLGTLTQGALWVTEETRLMPELFALLGQRASPVPPMRLHVSANGPVQASINNRALELRSNTPTASLLALLAWSGGSVAVQPVLDELTLVGRSARLRRQNLSRAVGELRAVLGWPEAVQTDGRMLKLDRFLHLEPLALPARADHFCAGLDDPWISAWRENHDEFNMLIKIE